MAFLIRRLLQGILVMLVVSLISFTVFNYVGDPVANMVPQDASPEERQVLREKLGLDEPVFVQFARYISRVAQGEFGLSYRNQRSVSSLLAARMPATVELVLCATVVSILIGIASGVFTALKRGSILSNSIQFVSLIGISIPTFVTGIMLIYIFSVHLHWLPSFGRGGVTNIGWWTSSLLSWKGISHLILPTLMLAFFQIALILRIVRSEMLEVLRTDYIRFARARGISNRIINFRYALRNALVPVITVVGMQIGIMIVFSIVTETVFQWPGLGLLFIQAVTFADIPVIAAYLLLVSVIFVVMNIIVDYLYYIVDPRLKSTKMGSAGHAA